MKCKYCKSENGEYIEEQGYFNNYFVCADCGKVTID